MINNDPIHTFCTLNTLYHVNHLETNYFYDLDILLLQYIFMTQIGFGEKNY